MKPLIVANWKVNPITRKEAEALFEKIKEAVSEIKNTEIVICSPFIYLSSVASNEGGFVIGAQNCFYEEKGAFTGEISALMLKDLGIDYVILGHSERRKYFKETDEIVNKKIKKALEAELKVIFCIGETAEERDKGEKNKVLERQIKQGLADVNNLENVNIAYEPVWAIGTGNNCSVDETKESVDFIRKIISDLYGKEAEDNIRILYGGSVKSENSGAYVKDAGANGLLVGGASLNAEEFIKIVKSAE